MIPYYRLLGVSRTADAVSIKRAYRELARRYHPDHHDGNPIAEDRFRLIAEAYSILSDEEQRKNYDRFGVAGLQTVGPDTGMVGKVGRLVTELGTILESRMRRGPRRGKDQRIPLDITLEQACMGAKRTIEFPVVESCSKCAGCGAEPNTTTESCHVCEGKGVVRASWPLPVNEPCLFCAACGTVALHPCASCDGLGKQDGVLQFDVDVPRGVTDGRCLVVRGQGEPGLNGGESGDLFIEIRIVADPWRVKSGLDITCSVPISLEEAVFGGELDVPILEGGTICVRIPKASGNGRTLRLRNRGALNSDGSRRGDMFIQLQVEVPIFSSKGREIVQLLEKESTYPERNRYRDDMTKRAESK